MAFIIGLIANGLVLYAMVIGLRRRSMSEIFIINLCAGL